MTDWQIASLLLALHNIAETLGYTVIAIMFVAFSIWMTE